MPAKTKDKTIAELVRHFNRSSASLVKEARDAVANGDSEAFERVREKASNTEVARLISTMVSTSQKHYDALVVEASAIGNASKFTKGATLFVLGLCAYFAGKGVLIAVGIVLLFCGIVAMYDAVFSDGFEKVIQGNPLMQRAF